MSPTTATSAFERSNPAGIITTVAGNSTPEDVLNTNGGNGGPATAAQLAGVLSIALYPTGTTLYIADIDANLSAGST